MNFNKHSDIAGAHAFLSGSKYHWINYDLEKLSSAYRKYLAVKKGTELHAFASMCIELRQKLPRNKQALNTYVNDAIAYKMIPEQPLYYSTNAFGTADAISFTKNLLRIHDLKTGISPVSMNQLLIYAALFCLEYDYDPSNIEIELRIYQNDGFQTLSPESQDIISLMERIIEFDKLIDKLKNEEGV